MKRSHLLSLAALCVTCTTASAATHIEGFAVKVGFNSTSGDLGDGSTSSGFTVGADYTFANGFIVGANYKPEFAADKLYYSDGFYTERLEISADMITPYVGYQFDSVYFHAGIGLIDIEGTYSYSDPYYSDSESDTDDDTGPMFGFGTQLPNNMTLDASVTFIDWEGLDGNNWNVSLGYKF